MIVKLKLAVLFFSTLIVAYGLIGGLMDKVSAGDETYRDLSIFTSVLDKVKNDYVEAPDMEKALKGALHGMMEALDPYSSFVDATTYQALQSRADGASVGLIVSKRYGYAYVVSVTRGSPADIGGLRSGDLIESIDGEPSALMSLWEAQKKLNGADESQVELRVLRSRTTSPNTLTLTRRILEPLEVEGRIVENKVGMLVIPHFSAGVSDLVGSKLKMLRSREIAGLIVDVRGSAEGELEEAVSVADQFLPQEAPILAVRRNGDEVENFLSEDVPIISDLPIVVLVDGGTSGVGEIFAAALKDNDLAELIGQRTNGLGSIQEMFQLGDGSVLFVSTRMFYRPTEAAIQGEDIRSSGLKPGVLSPDRDFVTNFYLENTPEDIDRDLDPDFYRRLDEAIGEEQLEDGLERLREKIESGEQLPEKKAA
jgi:carboxyl-terminal processing protease